METVLKNEKIKVKGFSIGCEDDGPTIEVNVSIPISEVFSRDVQDPSQESEFFESLGRVIIEELIKKDPHQ